MDISNRYQVNHVSKAPASEEGKKIRDICLENGVLPGLGGIYTNVLRIQPPLVISKQEMDEVIRVLEMAL